MIFPETRLERVRNFVSLFRKSPLDVSLNAIILPQLDGGDRHRTPSRS